MGGVPVQQGEALPEGREALHAGRAPGSPADAARARRGARLPADRLGHRARPHGARDPAHPGRVRPRRLRRADRRLADQREGVPDGQVRAGGRAHRQHRLQRPALHGVGGGRVEEDSRHRSQRQPVERHPEGEGDSRRRREHRRVRPDHHRLSLAGARERREADRARSAHDADRPHRRSLHPGALGRRHRRLLRHAPRHGAARLDQPRVHRRAYHRLGRRRGDRRALHAGIRGDDRRACPPR